MAEPGLAQQLVTSLFEPGVSRETFTILRTTLVTLVSLGLIVLATWGVDKHIIILICFALGLLVTVTWYVTLAEDSIFSFMESMRTQSLGEANKKNKKKKRSQGEEVPKEERRERRGMRRRALAKSK
eukprot:gb/GEZN01019523.1/.p2 GENE.gb/GEZN01019523.1/~~gb/GEZN01019523.1/.p2  ORF type:complete len:127 (+),score=19.86 gb/GEZN01019523.1/:53-433(+)